HARAVPAGAPSFASALGQLRGETPRREGFLHLWRSTKITAHLRGALWRTAMKKILLGTVAVITFAAAPAMAQQTIKIGFISTFSGPVAAIGADMRNAFELGLDHYGRKIGGLPVEVIYEDDQTKPEVGVQKTQKLIESDKVDFVVGYIWSNVLLASLKPLID